MRKGKSQHITSEKGIGGGGSGEVEVEVEVEEEEEGKGDHSKEEVERHKWRRHPSPVDS